jgi:hypothetical protein
MDLKIFYNKSDYSSNDVIIMPTKSIAAVSDDATRVIDIKILPHSYLPSILQYLVRYNCNKWYEGVKKVRN